MAVVLPLPDSPTSPIVSPRARSKLTSSTARTGPAGVSNSTLRPRIESSGAAAPLGAGNGPAAARLPRTTSSRPASRWWRFSRGLRMSSSAVPSRVVASTTNTIARPGGKNAHHAPADTAPRLNAKFSIFPQLMTVGSPRPMNARVDSDRIARLTTRTALAIISGRTSGTMCRRMMWLSDAPMARARDTNFRSRTVSDWDRTRRAVVVQPRMPMTKMIVNRLGPRTATSTIWRARSGMTRKKSVNRISPPPVRPPL